MYETYYQIYSYITYIIPHYHVFARILGSSRWVSLQSKGHVARNESFLDSHLTEKRNLDDLKYVKECYLYLSIDTSILILVYIYTVAHIIHCQAVWVAHMSPGPCPAWIGCRGERPYGIRGVAMHQRDHEVKNEQQWIAMRIAMNLLSLSRHFTKIVHLGCVRLSGVVRPPEIR